MAEAVIGMAHRSRSSNSSTSTSRTRGSLFNEFEGGDVGSLTMGSGDVKYHPGRPARSSPATATSFRSNWPATRRTEAVNPVVLGMVRADGRIRPGQHRVRGHPVLPLLLPATAFAGQGVVAETLGLSQIRGHRVGGCVHRDQQPGRFHHVAGRSRSSGIHHVAKMIQAPIFPLNGDDPEACVRRPTGVRVPPEVQLSGRRDRHDLLPTSRSGEATTPTRSRMYRRIDERASVRELYTTSLVKRSLHPRR